MLSHFIPTAIIFMHLTVEKICSITSFNWILKIREQIGSSSSFNLIVPHIESNNIIIRWFLVFGIITITITVFVFINFCRTFKVFCNSEPKFKSWLSNYKCDKSSKASKVMWREQKIGRNKISNCDYVQQCLAWPYQYPTRQIWLLFLPVTVFFLCF